MQPIIVQFGKDSIEDIGDPRVSNKNSNLIQLWEDTCIASFKEVKKNASIDFNYDILLEKYSEFSLDQELVAFE